MAIVELKKKVCILGTASSSVNEAPLDDDSFEFWALAWRKDLQKYTRLFDLHPFTDERFARKKIPPDYINHLSSLNCPIYLQKTHPEIPSSIPYPLNQVIETFGPKLDLYSSGIYFASSVAYMICLALLEKFEEIHFYGVDLIDGGEYAYQRPNTEYYIGLARGLGVKIFIPEKSALCKFSHVYGYEQKPDVGLINSGMLAERLVSYQDKMDTAMKAWYAADGARQEAEQLSKMLQHHERGSLTEDPKKPDPESLPVAVEIKHD